eukprot:scaffold600_cov193-Ochromonas_danica.AAC.13
MASATIQSNRIVSGWLLRTPSGATCGKKLKSKEAILTGYCGKNGHLAPVIPGPLSTTTKAIILVGHSHFSTQAARYSLHGPPQRTVIHYANVNEFLSRQDALEFLNAMNTSDHILTEAGSAANTAKIVQDTIDDHAVCGDDDAEQLPQCGVYLWERSNPAQNQVQLVYTLQGANDSVSISQAFAAHHPKYLRTHRLFNPLVRLKALFVCLRESSSCMPAAGSLYYLEMQKV